MIGKFIKGLAFGAVVGGVAGLLLAPRSGNETRRKLIDEVDEATDLTYDLSDSLKAFQDSLITLKSTAVEVLPTFKEETQKPVASYKFKAEPRLAEITKQVEQINQHLEKNTDNHNL